MCILLGNLIAWLRSNRVVHMRLASLHFNNCMLLLLILWPYPIYIARKMVQRYSNVPRYTVCDEIIITMRSFYMQRTLTNKLQWFFSCVSFSFHWISIHKWWRVYSQCHNKFQLSALSREWLVTKISLCVQHFCCWCNATFFPFCVVRVCQ